MADEGDELPGGEVEGEVLDDDGGALGLRDLLLPGAGVGPAAGRGVVAEADAGAGGGQRVGGRRLLLVDRQGEEFTLEITPALRAALRGETTRIGQLEIQMTSTLRPREIQMRIRAGETPEAVATAAQTTVEAIMPFAPITMRTSTLPSQLLSIAARG